MKLFIRNEIKEEEHRTPLVPKDCGELIKKGFEIYVEPSFNRCFPISQYLDNECIVTHIAPEDATIIGLKELDMKSKMFQHKNIYFAHCYKNQSNAKIILDKFKKEGGCILDYEYIVDENNKRMIAFGYWAGFAGTYLGLIQYIRKMNGFDDINNVSPCNNYQNLINNLRNFDITPKIAIIGINGRCGQGCRKLLDSLYIKYTGFNHNDEKNLFDYEIIINCIYLSPTSNEVFISKKNISGFKNLKIIVDISCDVFAKNNPIQLDYELTTFKNPVFKYDNLDIIAIDNLPTLLPKDSSEEFSNKLVTLLQDNKVWDNLEILYKNHLC